MHVNITNKIIIVAVALVFISVSLIPQKVHATSLPSTTILTPASDTRQHGTITVATSDQDTSGSGLNKVELFVDGTLNSTTSAYPYSFNLNTNPLTDGNHVLTTEAFDNSGDSNTSLGVNVSVDNGDINVDGQVNITDLSILASHWGQSGGYSQGDLNGDGVIDILDLSILASNWGTTNNPTSSLASQIVGAYSGPTNISGVNAVGTFLGHNLKYAMEFLNGSTWSSITATGYPLTNWQSSGYNMIWGLPILPNTYSPSTNINDTTGSAYGLMQGAQGQFNQYWVTVANNLVSDGYGSSIIRLAWEFNGGWFPWAANGQQTNFIQYWQNIVNEMRSVSNQHFIFEWNPTLGDQGVGDLATYYPGDSYVDLVGEDVYDSNWSNYPGCQANWNNMLTESYGLNWFASFATLHNKPMTFPEWGLGFGTYPTNCGTLSNTGGQVGGGDNAYFVSHIANWIDTHNVYEATVWNDGSGTVPSSGTFPQATDAIISGFGN